MQRAAATTASARDEGDFLQQQQQQQQHVSNDLLRLLDLDGVDAAAPQLSVAELSQELAFFENTALNFSALGAIQQQQQQQQQHARSAPVAITMPGSANLPATTPNALMLNNKRKYPATESAVAAAAASNMLGSFLLSEQSAPALLVPLTLPAQDTSSARDKEQHQQMLMLQQFLTQNRNPNTLAWENSLSLFAHAPPPVPAPSAAPPLAAAAAITPAQKHQQPQQPLAIAPEREGNAPPAVGKLTVKPSIDTGNVVIAPTVPAPSDRASGDSVSAASDSASSSGLGQDDDKRRRNTAASARFRLRKKQREAAMEQSAKDMSARCESLTTRVRELETEVTWLRSLLVERDGVNKVSQLATAWQLMQQAAAAQNTSVEEPQPAKKRGRKAPTKASSPASPLSSVSPSGTTLHPQYSANGGHAYWAAASVPATPTAITFQH
ncbi:hypothetical protein RI367_005650 [Sorochytrium milnesiophthora]